MNSNYNHCLQVRRLKLKTSNNLRTQWQEVAYGPWERTWPLSIAFFPCSCCICTLTAILVHPACPCLHLHCWCLFLPIKICGIPGEQFSPVLWVLSRRLLETEISNQNSPSPRDLLSQNLKTWKRKREYGPLGFCPRGCTVIHSPAWKRAFFQSERKETQRGTFINSDFSLTHSPHWAFSVSLSSVSSFIYSLGRSGIKPLKNGGFSSLYFVGAAGEMARLYLAVCVYVCVCVCVGGCGCVCRQSREWLNCPDTISEGPLWGCRKAGVVLPIGNEPLG